MTVRFERLKTPYVIDETQPLTTATVRDIIKMIVATQNFEATEVPAGNRREFPLPELMEKCTVRAFDGPHDASVGEVIIEGEKPTLAVLNYSNAKPKRTSDNKSIFPVDAQFEYQLLVELVSEETALIHAIVRYLD